MSHRACVVFAIAAAAFTAAADAQAIDPCSLLSDADLADLGVAKDSARSRESRPGGVLVCKYQPASGDGRVSVLLSQGVPERVLQLRAMQAKAREEGTPAQLQARGEYFEGAAMCKVVLASAQETSQCVGATEQSVVALSLSRPTLGDKVAYPAPQLKLTSALVSRVASGGG